MIREYCDKCRREIQREDTSDWNGKKDVEVSYVDNRSTYDQYKIARVTLCKNCFAQIGIDKAVERIKSNNKKEKEPAAVDKLLDIIRELVVECMEE